MVNDVTACEPIQTPSGKRHGRTSAGVSRLLRAIRWRVSQQQHPLPVAWSTPIQRVEARPRRQRWETEALAEAQRYGFQQSQVPWNICRPPAAISSYHRFRYRHFREDS